MPSQPPAILTFGETLSALMQERRVGAGHLARETGIDVRLIRKYKAGTTIPRDYFGYPTENAVKLAAVLDVAVDVLVAPIEEAAA